MVRVPARPTLRTRKKLSRQAFSPIMFTARFHQPAPHYRGGMSRKATWRECAMSNVAGTARPFGRSTSLESSKCLLDRAAIAQLDPQLDPEAHP